MARMWTREEVLELARSFQPACVLAAAADLDVFGALADHPATSSELARRVGSDGRATTILLDALAALQLLDKHGETFSVPESLVETLGGTGPRSVLSMARHQANCLRRWARLPTVVKHGRPSERTPSIRGEAADQQAFILAMNDLASRTADALIRHIHPLEFRCLLDVGGGSGTWTLAFLRACPSARAILFDLPDVIPLAEQRFAEAGMSRRVTLVPGDFYRDALPHGADLAWISAILHQSSRGENRELLRKVAAGLVDDGRVAIRELLMDPSRTEPLAGALFAVNMLVNTEAGGTFTCEELCEDLTETGFTDVAVAHREPSMNSILTARKASRRGKSSSPRP